jgi:hypothetical protein
VARSAGLPLTPVCHPFDAQRWRAPAARPASSASCCCIGKYATVAWPWEDLISGQSAGDHFDGRYLHLYDDRLDAVD